MNPIALPPGTPLIEGWAAVYRLFDKDGRLLYIGSTVDPDRRWQQHRRERRWWSEVAGYKLDWHQGRSRAYKAEDAAIKAERPLYNGSGTPSHAAKCRAGYVAYRLRSGYAMRDGRPISEPTGELAVEMRRALAAFPE